MSSTLSDLLLGPTKVFGLQLWVVICILVGILIPLVLSILFLWLIPRRRLKMTKFSLSQIPNKSKEIKVDEVSANNLHSHFPDHVGALFPFNDKPSMKESEKTSIFLDWSRSIDTDSLSQCSWAYHLERARGSQSDEDVTTWHRRNPSSQHFSTDSPSMGLPDTSRLGWGHWFTLRDLEFATNRFSKDNILGEGGYGVVYKGRLINGTPVAVKKIRNNTGQAENEFSVEVEAIGHARHKNLVRLLGYCIEGTHRLLVYEYVNNGNLEEWLHGTLRQHGSLSWEARLKVILGTAKGLAYLHDGIEPKVVHRDIKSGNILIDENFNAKVSDFGLAKLLGAGESHVATRVMGTLGYVAPEYANTGLLNEKSDVYSFGILLMEAITGRDPVDYGRPPGEENLVEWLKQMVGSRRSEEVVDPNLEVKPSTRALKRALLVAFRCIDPDSEKRPQMGQVVRMLEAADFSYHEDWRNQPNRPSGSIEIESLDHGS